MTPRTRPRMASQQAEVGVGSADIGATCIRTRSEDALPSARRMLSAAAALQATSMASSAAVTTFGRHRAVSPRRMDATAVASHCDCGVASLDTMLISCQAAVLQHRPSQASAGHVIAVRVACGADGTAARALNIRARPRCIVDKPSSRMPGPASDVRALRKRRCGFASIAGIYFSPFLTRKESHNCYVIEGRAIETQTHRNTHSLTLLKASSRAAARMRSHTSPVARHHICAPVNTRTTMRQGSLRKSCE